MPVYAMRCGDYVKVGTTDYATARRRLRQIQAMCPYPVTLAGESRLTELDTAPLTVESWHHDALAPYHFRGEWFHWNAEMAGHVVTYFRPLNEVAPPQGPPPRRLGACKTRLRDAAKGRLG